MNLSLTCLQKLLPINQIYNVILITTINQIDNVIQLITTINQIDNVIQLITTRL